MKKLFLAALLLTGIFTLAACDGSDSSQQGVTEDTIKVGNSAATSGALAFVGEPFNDALQAYLDMVNDDGGVAGREIEFIHYDDEFDPAQGTQYAERLVEDDEIFAFVGHFGTPTVGATQDYLNEVGIPRVYYATGSPVTYNENAEGGERASFPVQPMYNLEGRILMSRAINDYDAEKVGVIYSNADDGKGLLEGIEEVADREDIELIKQQVAPDASDMSSQASSIVDENPDAVIVAANQQPAETAITALYDEGNEADVLTTYVNAAESMIENLDTEVSSEQFELFASQWVSLFDEDGDPNEGYQEYLDNVPEDIQSNTYAITGWIAAAFFVEGLERVGEDELTWDSYIEAMEEEPVENPMGAPIDYSDGQRIGTAALALVRATVTDDDEYLWEEYDGFESEDDLLE
ncbi:MAG: ABC transporter substrate-binding protein [Candidatus Izemoplasmataceae bacterium]